MFFIPIQLKIQCNVKMGPPPPGGLPAKRGDDAGMSSEDDGLPRSPPEMSLLHDISASTIIKASAACTSHISIHPHHIGQPGPLGAPVCSSEIPMVGVAGLCVARRDSRPCHEAHSWYLFAFFE